jgi:TRAP-type C4-dicarboxylate transport system permease small subunit
MVDNKDRKISRRILDWIFNSPDKLSHLLFAVSCAFAILLGFFIFVSCLGRYLFNRPIHGIYEISGYALYIMTFLAIPYLMKYDKHVCIDAIVDILPAAVQRILKILNYIVCLIMGVVLFYYSFILTHNLYKSGLVLFDTLEPPKYILMLFVPLCFLPFSVIALKKIIGSIKTLGSTKDLRQSLEEKA